MGRRLHLVFRSRERQLSDALQGRNFDFDNFARACVHSQNKMLVLCIRDHDTDSLLALRIGRQRRVQFRCSAQQTEGVRL